MILFYCPGNALGHLSRVLAILHHSELLTDCSRILTTSVYADLARSISPVPIDMPPAEVCEAPKLMAQYLEHYIQTHAIDAMVVDTYLWGRSGELSYLAHSLGSLPTVLLARNLRYDLYFDQCEKPAGQWRYTGVLIVDALAPTYHSLLTTLGAEVFDLQGPLLHSLPPETPAAQYPEGFYLLVHAGPRHEIEYLRAEAQPLLKDAAMDDAISLVLTPGDGIFPADEKIDRYGLVISGGGYNLACRSAFNPRHHIIPFERRFDDQQFRVDAIVQGRWPLKRENCAPAAARWLEQQLLSGVSADFGDCVEQ